MAQVIGPWVKARASSPSGNCVEFANLDNGNIGVRDSKNPTGPVLEFTRSEVDAFVQGAVAGDFDSFR